MTEASSRTASSSFDISTLAIEKRTLQDERMAREAARFLMEARLGDATTPSDYEFALGVLR